MSNETQIGNCAKRVLTVAFYYEKIHQKTLKRRKKNFETNV